MFRSNLVDNFSALLIITEYAAISRIEVGIISGRSYNYLMACRGPSTLLLFRCGLGIMTVVSHALSYVLELQIL